MALVVLLDDESRLLKTLSRFLEAAGHVVKTAERFSQIEAELDPTSFDVLLTDVLMPDMSGLDVVRTLKARGCKQPLVVMTGESSPGARAAAEALGVFEFMLKPVTKDEVLDLVARATGS